MPQNGIDNIEGDIIVDWLTKYGLPVNRKNYIEVMYPDGAPTPWTAEQEEQLPEELQDWDNVEDDTDTAAEVQA